MTFDDAEKAMDWYWSKTDNEKADLKEKYKLIEDTLFHMIEAYLEEHR